MIAKHKRALRFGMLVTLLLSTAIATAVDSFPGAEPDRRVLKIQEKVDKLFEKGDYERAIFIYREDLVPLGDKFAQYMIGYMYLTGKGVEQDVPTAAAWYRIAAERGDPSFVQARDEVLPLLNEQQRTESDRLHYDLHRQYGDVALLVSMIGKDLEILRRFTMSTPVSQIDFAQTFDQRKAAYIPVAERLEQRIELVMDLSASREPVDPTEPEVVDSLYMEVKRELNTYKAAK